ncbi:hypothetical protein VH569_27940 [Azospirillum sp. 11R-A]|uniref:hypothetical protein n=1 Tax=Azospirillum sp. 11R-A TaxID=3111634 RepID=UPI003C27A26C
MADCRQRCQRTQIPVDQFAAGRQVIQRRFPPAAALQQRPGSLVDVVAPRGEHAQHRHLVRTIDAVIITIPATIQDQTATMAEIARHMAGAATRVTAVGRSIGTVVR